jgi:hypothetical protein
MAVTMLPSSALAPSRLAPRLIESLIGNLLELMIHTVEDWRERRDRPGR